MPRFDQTTKPKWSKPAAVSSGTHMFTSVEINSNEFFCFRASEEVISERIDKLCKLFYTHDIV